jgi:hypothetical protein
MQTYLKNPLLRSSLILKIFSFFWVACLSMELSANGVYDQYSRLISIPGKTIIPCPVQDHKTAVLLVFGQSLSANSGAEKISSLYPQVVVNYFDGKCYSAGSPLLGGSNEFGEYGTAIGDALIKSKKYSQVILISSGISGSGIYLWEKGGELNSMLINTLKTTTEKYKITHVLWQQGESDYLGGTSTLAYKNAFYSLVNTLRENSVSAPIYIAISTKCGPHFLENNPVSTAQKQLIDNKNIFLGVNSDLILETSDRVPDECHLTGSGERKIADSFARAILKSPQKSSQ